MIGETWINECPRLYKIYKKVITELVSGQQPRWHKGVAGILCTDAMFHRIAIGHVHEEHLKESIQHMVKYGSLKESTEKESSFWTRLVTEI
ncbi:Hypothetical predicted protein [Paramuricea clavata]|uniref:Uncharacterized protein n=1 Tax=Paramuricea clavata TaxID=317549 RepID=A0A7D9DE41_PARCT|nr:Hypothetical predicted protein [Paramuricea clavata]CAB3982459.1 Hypothetical predicted protein [Paramuricea clavata]